MGQPTFNQRLHFEHPAALLTNVAATDTGYLAFGIVSDSIFPFRAGLLTAQFNLQGDLIFANTAKSPEHTMEFWYSTLLPTPDGEFLLVGAERDSLSRALLVRVDAQGNILAERNIVHPNYPEYSFLEPVDMQWTPDQGLIITCWQEGLNSGDVNIGVIKLDSLWNNQWRKTYGNLKFERPWTTEILADGSLIIGAVRMNINQTAENYTWQTWILAIDSLGNELWNYFSPIEQLRDAANGLFVLENGDLLIASGFGTEYENPSVNDVYFEKSLARINPYTGTLIWEREYKGPHAPTSIRTVDVIPVPGEEALVAIGSTIDVFPIEDGFRQWGWIHKSTLDGDSVWTREYQYLETVNSYHILYDIKSSADGGYILAGEIRDISGADSIPQQAWILKVDEYGCLIPGCQLVNTSEVELNPSLDLAIYPNPATDYLHFEIRTSATALAEGNIQIVDTQGRIEQSFPQINEGVTYVAPLFAYPPGVYFLQYLVDGQIINSKPFIKQ